MKIGIDLGGSHIAIGLINYENKIVEKVEKRLTEVEKEDIRRHIEDYIIENVNKLRMKNEIEEIGIAVPGTIYDGTILKSVNLGFEQYNLQQILERQIGMPIKIRNDAKCAALAENKLGALKGKSRVLFLTLGTGIGGAVIIDGKLLDTGKYPGLEIGHMIIEKDGRECKCGNHGCFERYASMKILKNALRKEWGLTESTRGQELLSMLRSGREETSVQEFIDYLSIGIANLINIFEPEAVGIGGSFVFFENILLNKLKKNIIDKNLLFNKREKLDIVTAVLGNDAGIIGAVL